MIDWRWEHEADLFTVLKRLSKEWHINNPVENHEPIQDNSLEDDNN